MITKDSDGVALEVIRLGYVKGLIKLIDSPMGDGTVAQIGPEWFYFGGSKAADMGKNEYYYSTPYEEVINEIREAFNDLTVEDPECFNNCCRYLADNDPDLALMLDKKRNAEYWDEIDNSIAEMIKKIADNHSKNPINSFPDPVFSYADLEEAMYGDGILPRIRDILTDFLEEFGALFPYVD